MNSILLYSLIKMKLTCFSGFIPWMIVSGIILAIGIGFLIYTYTKLDKEKEQQKDFGLYRGLGIGFTVIGSLMLIGVPIIYNSKAETIMAIPCLSTETDPKEFKLCQCLGAVKTPQVVASSAYVEDGDTYVRTTTISKNFKSGSGI